MARTFKRKSTAQPIADLNVTNLIDLGFTLLIIFMTTAVVQKEQTMRVDLPIVAKSQPEHPDPGVTITIDAKGNYALNGKPVIFRELQAELVSLAAAPKPPVVYIHGDRNAAWGKIAQVVDEMKRHNLLRMGIDTEAAK